MTLPLLSIFPAVAAIVVLAISVTAFLRSRAKNARRAKTVKERIESAQAQLDRLRASAVAGEVTPEHTGEAERRIGAKLIEGETWTRSLRKSQRKAAWRVAWGTGGALALAGLALGVALWGGERAPSMAGRTVELSADSAASGPPAPQAAGNPTRVLSEDALQRMIDVATVEVRRNPKDSASWAMLAHSYDMLGKFAEASKAYAKLSALLPKDAQVLADYADALGVAHGRTLSGEPAALVARALAIDGQNLKALTLSGTAAFERGDYAHAVDFWQRARVVSKDASFTRQIETSLAEAKAALKGDTTPTTQMVAASPAGSGVSAEHPTISGRVTLADDLVAQSKPDATVFIFARPAKGSRMPVAILRKRVRDLPVDFVLDDSMSMVPDQKLSRQSTVVIGARVSQRGDVMPQAGDMQGWSAPVQIGATGLRLEISEVLK